MEAAINRSRATIDTTFTCMTHTDREENDGASDRPREDIAAGIERAKELLRDPISASIAAAGITPEEVAAAQAYFRHADI
jgi:hypothetical protein